MKIPIFWGDRTSNSALKEAPTLKPAAALYDFQCFALADRSISSPCLHLLLLMDFFWRRLAIFQDQYSCEQPGSTNAQEQRRIAFKIT